MKKCTAVLLCMVLVLSLFCVNAAAAQSPVIEAGATVSEGVVTVELRALQTTANAHLTVDFDPNCLSYTGCETAFTVHTVKAEDGKLTIGLANATADAVSAGGTLAELSFAVTGDWKQTAIDITADGQTLTVLAGESRFEDVTADQWFYEAVETLAADGHIKGISQTRFGPGLNMNRASFVTLLGRLEGIAETQVQTRFTDVPVDSFYSGYVAWAVEKGITNGISETKFDPNGSVNRAQMVTFLYRYVVSEGIDVTVTDPETVLAQFPDADQLPDWAEAPFAWAIDRGVINGMDGKLAPAGSSNRAQVAVMLYRFFYEQ